MAYTEIDDPSAYFQTALYSGNAGTQSITNDGNSDLQPDWVWIKQRSGTQNHNLQDSVRGSTKIIKSNTTADETTDANGVTSFNTDGFSIGTRSDINQSGTYVAWQWKAGGSASSNSNGSITSSVSANTTSGFSIVSWTGNGSTATIGHGLGSAPKVVIIKSRDNSSHAWFLGHESLGWTKYMTLENTNGENTDVIWNNTAPTSSVFSVGGYSSTNGSGVKFIGYCFADTGNKFFKAGSYTGNGNANGTFIYTGFKPAFFMIKNTASGNNWHMMDHKRDSDNVVEQLLKANANDAENTTSGKMDFLSNGVKIRSTSTGANGSGATFIYMAFAENPFVSSSGIPTTAR